ncbi:RICIN domain-containing protein [Kutzneria buriramensis]|uniref:Ricin-type beta-trefoil lectin protein n=1 Tax=Kutzneria buriramensis TaxID=1045776 RepID=A0A3E0HH45_9PSEU|nr:RICIN domain-containing protein [Kutzneria buriramensis]REH44847.1 ricin-type beta-trefoil lectin protein [Kutzneria buriramensis]
MNIKHIRRVAAGVIAAAATTLAAFGTVGTANAAPALSVSHGTTAYWIAPTPDSMAMAVADSETWPGAPVIQWYNTGGNEQKWYFDGVYDPYGTYLGFLLRNKNSGLCLDTDGVAGHGLVQQYCDANSHPTEIFNNYPNYDVFGILISWRYQNRQTGLWLDDYGRGLNPGNVIDLWYQNYNDNQDFFLTQAP